MKSTEESAEALIAAGKLKNLSTIQLTEKGEFHQNFLLQEVQIK